METDILRYDAMVQGALRGVVREALTQVAEHGLPGNHHFFITFRTDHPDVVLPDHLRAEHGVEMTIVLQHQFWGLEIGADAFSVTLRFRKANEHLSVPFAAVTRFVDPAVNFGLQMQATGPDGTALAPTGTEAAEGAGAGNTGQDGGKDGGAGPGHAKGQAGGQAEDQDGDQDGDQAGGNVVALEAFRKP